jgi:hypothetical protein
MEGVGGGGREIALLFDTQTACWVYSKCYLSAFIRQDGGSIVLNSQNKFNHVGFHGTSFQ